MGDMHATLLSLKDRRQKAWTVPLQFDISEDADGSRVLDISAYIGQEARYINLDPPILQFPRQRFGFDDRQKLVKHFQVSARASGF